MSDQGFPNHSAAGGDEFRLLDAAGYQHALAIRERLMSNIVVRAKRLAAEHSS